jgi:nucleotide-binding universal stress UspA family protein
MTLGRRLSLSSISHICDDPLMGDRPSAQGYDRVLVAIDGTEDSSRILDHVAALAPIHDSEVIVFHVHQKAYSGAAAIDLDQPPVISAQDAAARLNRAGVRARAVEEDAYWRRTADAIVEAAERYSAKAIVMGTRGQSKLTSVVLGSVAYKVLHLSKQPVLVIP